MSLNERTALGAGRNRSEHGGGNREPLGRWKKNTAEWYEQTMLYCALCGKIIPKNLWVVDTGGEALVFCDPDCEELYREYWLPAQGRDA